MSELRGRMVAWSYVARTIRLTKFKVNLRNMPVRNAMDDFTPTFRGCSEMSGTLERLEGPS
jgi:hypothetical protein